MTLANPRNPLEDDFERVYFEVTEPGPDARGLVSIRPLGRPFAISGLYPLSALRFEEG